jgi:hypothetical protein
MGCIAQRDRLRATVEFQIAKLQPDMPVRFYSYNRAAYMRQRPRPRAGLISYPSGSPRVETRSCASPSRRRSGSRSQRALCPRTLSSEFSLLSKLARCTFA